MKKDYIEKVFTCHIMHYSNEHLSFCSSHFHLPVCQVFYLNLNVAIVGLTIHNGNPRFAKSFTETWILMWLMLLHCKQPWQFLGSFPAILLWEIPSYNHAHVLYPGTSWCQIPTLLGPWSLMLWSWHSWARADHARVVPTIQFSLLWQCCSIKFLLVLSLLNITTAEKHDNSFTRNKTELRK